MVLLFLASKTQRYMISQKDLPGYIEKSIPELSGICEKEKCKTAYDFVRQLLKYTSRHVIKHNMKIARQCMAIAEQLYKKGNKTIKNAIENIFVYSFTHTFFHDESRRKELVKIVPDSLYELYKKQVIYSHL
jgi:hypothetical protein